MSDINSKVLNEAKFAWLAIVILTMAAALLTQLNGAYLLILLPLFITQLKGQFIIDWFMGLNRAPRLWRILLSSYIWLIPAIIGGIYFY